MSTLTLHSTASAASMGGRVMRGFAVGLRTLATEWRARREMRALAGFDDLMLHDIGMDRGAIENAVRHGRRRIR